MYRLTTATFVLGTLVGCSSSAQPPKEPAPSEACVATTSTGKSEIESPSVAANAILRPGDVACFTFDAAHNAQAVPQAPANTPHVSAEFTAEPGMTMLLMNNRTSTDLTYRALMRLPGASEWQETSILPVRAGLLGGESWPHPIDALALFELRSAPAR